MGNEDIQHADLFTNDFTHLSDLRSVPICI